MPAKSDNTLMQRSFPRTLRLKVRGESYAWLNAAANEVNTVFNYCNETSLAVATRTDLKRRWLTGFDLCNLTAGATEYFERNAGSRCRTSVSGNEPLTYLHPPGRTYRVREARPYAWKSAA